MSNCFDPKDAHIWRSVYHNLNVTVNGFNSWLGTFHLLSELLPSLGKDIKLLNYSSVPISTNPAWGTCKNPQGLLKKNRGISLVLVACPLSDILITEIPANEEPLCGNEAVCAVIIMSHCPKTSMHAE